MDMDMAWGIGGEGEERVGILTVQVLRAVVTQRRVRVRLVDNYPLHEAGESGDHLPFPSASISARTSGSTCKFQA